MTPTDREALELAVAIARRDPAQAQRIADNLAAGAPWLDVAESAAFHCQIEALNLLPWQTPPAYSDACSDPSSQDGARLLRKMQSLGVSRWHPDPVRECERVMAETMQVAVAR